MGTRISGPPTCIFPPAASPTPAAPRGSTRGGASKRVARTALWFCRTVATGGRRAKRQRPPRAGIFPPNLRIKLSRKWGPGGGRLRAPFGARRSRPPAIFSPLLDRSKRGSPPGRRNPPQSNGAAQNRREEQAPPLRVQMGRAGLGPAPTDGAPSGRALQGCNIQYPPHHGGAGD